MKLYEDKLIIVTGGFGFIGSCIVQYLNDHNMSNIVIVDDLEESPDKWQNLVGKKFVEYIPKDKFLKWLETPGRDEDIEAFVHMGAISSTVETNVELLMENNYRYTLRLMEYAVKYGHRFIYASSAATYGDGSLGFFDNHDMLEKLRPLNPYGYSKHLVDLWAKDQGVLNKVLGFKLFNVFGPNEFHKGRMSSVVYNLLPQIQENKTIKLFKSNDPQNFADGEQCRDFIYVKDVAKVVYQALNNDCCGIYNLGRGVAESWNSLAKAMFKALGQEPNIEYIDMPKDLNDKYQNYTCADTTKLEKDFRFKSESLEESVSDYIKNYLLPHKHY